MRGRFIFILKALGLAGLVFLKTSYPLLAPSWGITARVIDAAIYFAIGHLVIDLLRLLIIYLYSRRFPPKKRVKNNFSLGIAQIAGILSLGVFLLAFLYALNIRPLTVLTSLTIVAAAIAIVSKDYVSNMINGLIIMFTNQLAIGDYIKTSTTTGTIEDITLINIHLVTDDGELVYLPNLLALNTEVTNYTKRLERKAFLEFEVPRMYLQRLPELENQLLAELKSYEKEMLEEPRLEVTKVLQTHSVFHFYFSFNYADKYRERRIKQKLARIVISYLNKHLPA